MSYRCRKLSDVIHHKMKWKLKCLDYLHVLIMVFCCQLPQFAVCLKISVHFNQCCSQYEMSLPPLWCLKVCKPFRILYISTYTVYDLKLEHKVQKVGRVNLIKQIRKNSMLVHLFIKVNDQILQYKK